MLNYQSLAEALVVRGGVRILEHPDDPGEEPFPSVWATDVFEEFARRTGSKCCCLHQCMFGGPAKKPTRLATNIVEFEDKGPVCDGS